MFENQDAIIRQAEALKLASEYCKKNNVHGIMQMLLQALVIEQPAEPIDYLIKLLDNDKSIEQLMKDVDEFSNA